MRESIIERRENFTKDEKIKKKEIFLSIEKNMLNEDRERKKNSMGENITIKEKILLRHLINHAEELKNVSFNK